MYHAFLSDVVTSALPSAGPRCVVGEAAKHSALSRAGHQATRCGHCARQLGWSHRGALAHQSPVLDPECQVESGPRPAWCPLLGPALDGGPGW